MTPCEKLGYKVGDEFELTSDHFYYSVGDVATLAEDDGTTFPMFFDRDGAPDIAISLCKVRKVGDGKAMDPITTLRQARKTRDEAEQAYQYAIAGVREALGEGFLLSDTAEPDEDMTDPANWREGDVFEVLDGKACGARFENGIMVRKESDNGSSFVTIDGSDRWSLPNKAVRFHHRP